MTEGARRQHQDGLERLRQGREFAEWSRKDQEARLPKLTDEQQEQMRQYLRLVNQHGLSKILQDCKEGEDCPATGTAKKQIETVRETK